ncbi:MAG TPA: SDR family oxidoreductase [Gammaproteobacteria bacterium]|nr:SDR family oxidoreductase [Gammaproteobacteria bacterium]
MELKNKVILVTGGSKGIGLGISEYLAKTGATVILTSRTHATAAQTADNIRKRNPDCKISGFSFDLEDPSSMKRLIAETVAQYGRLDSVVNNAVSKSILVPIASGEDALIDSSITANISSVVKLCKYAYPHLKVTRGSIVNITSSITKRYINNLPLYAMAKTAIARLTEALAADWAADGIRLNAVNPGFTRSSAFEDLGLSKEQVSSAYKYFSGFQPLGIAEPGDIAPIVGILISDLGLKITGSVFDIDGGHHIQGHPAMPPA